MIALPMCHRALTGMEFGDETTPTQVLLERLRSSAYTVLRGTSVVNSHTGWTIRFNRRGLDHTLRHAANTTEGRRHARSVLVLDALTEVAQLIYSEPNADPVQSGTLLAVHRLEALLDIGRERVIARLIVKESPSGYFLYDHRLRCVEPA